MDSAGILATMSIKLRPLLIKELARHMKTMSSEHACELAHELTNLMSTFIRSSHQGGTAKISTTTRLPCLPIETWNELTISVPWEAFSYAYSPHVQNFDDESTQALCSAPAQLDFVLGDQAVSSGLWGGSLLVALGKMLEDLEKNLVVFSPYWRVDGVRSLLAAAGRNSYSGVDVTVFTQPSVWMNDADRAGLSFFVNTIRAAGAVVQVKAPRSHEGLTPILHAKLIIADQVTAYVGSANFTKSGLDHGLEAGVLVKGHIANAFSNWSKAVTAICESWE